MIECSSSNALWQNGSVPGDAPAVPAASAPPASQLLIRFSTLTHVFDKHPAGHALPWDQLLSALSQYAYRADKNQGPLFSPATFIGPGKHKSEVEAVHFLALDFDDVTAEKAIEILGKLEPYAAMTYTTWKQPQASQQGLMRFRAVLPMSRSCSPQEWPAVYQCAVRDFGASALDTSCSDPNRFYFTPALPLDANGNPCSWAAQTWRSQGTQAWDVDAALSKPRAQEPAPIQSAGWKPGRDPIPREALSNLATSLKRASDFKAVRIGNLIRSGLDGHALTEGKGERHVVLRDLAFWIGQKFPTASAETIAEHFKLSLDLMRDGADEDPIKHFEGLILSAQRKVSDDANERALARVRQQNSNTALAWRALGVERGTPYTPAELAALEAANGPLARRHVLQHGRDYFVHLFGSYVGPLCREEFSAACAQYLAPASSAGVQVHSFDKDGRITIKPHEQLIGEYGQHLAGVEYDLTGRASRIENGVLLLESCPRRTDLAPAYDPEVAEWLVLLGGRKHAALLDWIATVTWTHECAPALYFMGENGVGKNLLVLGLARLWKAGKPTALKHALGEFNSELRRSPLVFGDEKVPETFKGEPRTEELRELITAKSHTINAKNAQHVTARGAVRVVLAANNLKLITAREELTREDAAALADRILFVVPDPAARNWLEGRGGQAYTGSFVDGDRIARHALWLAEQAATGARPIKQGTRLLLPGDAQELTRKIMVGSGLNWRVLSWVQAFLDDPARHVQASVGRPLAALVKGGAVWVAPKLLLAAWDHYLPNEKSPTFEQLSRTLRSLLVPAQEARYRPYTAGGAKTSYQRLRLEELASWCESEGVTDLAALLTRDTETLRAA